ncbi:hypothetical protein Peur_047817 [Populus x canadensis]
MTRVHVQCFVLQSISLLLCYLQVCHPNIDLEGNVCLNILGEDWKPILLLYMILTPRLSSLLLLRSVTWQVLKPTLAVCMVEISEHPIIDPQSWTRVHDL